MSQAGIIVEAGLGTLSTLTGNAGGAVSPTAGNINVLGAGVITTTGSGSTLTISIAGGGFTWNTVAGAAQGLVANNGYINANAGLTTFTLPAVAAVGDTFQIAGYGAGGWTVAQNVGQSIYLNATTTTIGIGGSLSSTNQFNTIQIMCIVANNEFTVLSSSGTLTVV